MIASQLIDKGASQLRHYHLSCCILFTTALASPTFAQPQTPPTVVVSSPLQVNPVGEEWHECSIGVSQTNKFEAMVAAIAAGQGIGTTSIFVLPGGTVLGHGYLPCGDLDPGVMGEPGTGRIWVSALDRGFLPSSTCNSGIVYGWKNPGQGSIPDPQMYRIDDLGDIDIFDKPLLASGPDHAGGNDPRHFVVNKANGSWGNYCSNNLNLATTTTTPLSGSDAWNITVVEPLDTSNCDWEGTAANPVVLDSGRIVTVINDTSIEGGWKYNEGRPHVVWSDDGGATWNSQDRLNPIVIDPSENIQATTIRVADPVCDDPPSGDTPFWIDRRRCGPTIAVDRSHDPNHVYVAFYAKSGDSSSTNTDIWIAKSTDGGASWSSDPEFQMPLTDAMLGLTGPDVHPLTGADQMMPAMAIDSCGGINLMYYDNRNDPDRSDRNDWVDVFYARITGFGPTAIVDHVELLTTETFPADICDGGMNGFLGDYHHMATSADGRLLWLAYIAREEDPGLGTWGIKNCYTHRVNISCPIQIDLNNDDIANETDAVLFATGWLAQDPMADINLDWIVNTSDFVTFAEWYAIESSE